MTIEDDDYFEIMIKNWWELDDEINDNDNILEILKQKDINKKK